MSVVPLAAAAVLQAQAPPLELKVGDAWLPWRGYGPAASAGRDTLLVRAMVWRDSQPGLRLGTFTVRTAGGSLTNSVAVLELDPTGFRFALAAAPGWRRRSARHVIGDSSVIVAANTGLFRHDGTPQGLVLVDGERRRPPAGWLDAVVVIAGGELKLVGPDRLSELPAGASAFQTLPWLVREGRVVFGVTSGERLSRTHRDRRFTLCLGGDGWVRLALSNFEVFGQAAGRIPIGLTIAEQSAIAGALGCRDAVALDGGISAQLAVRLRARVHDMPGWRRVPLMMIARRR